MRVPDSLTEKLLRGFGKITPVQIASLIAQAKAEKKTLQELATNSGLIAEKDLTKLYAKATDVPYVELDVREIKHEVLRLIPERIARQYNAVVFSAQPDGTKLLAISDPDDIQAVSFLQKQLGPKLKIHIATGTNIQA